MARRTKTQELLEFEIRFCEKLLGVYPDFVDVLIPLGEAYTRCGCYEKGLQVDLRLAQLRGDDSLTWYNLACSYTLLKRLDEAVAALQRAVSLGYRDLTYLQQDPDLVNLRQSPRYRDVLESFAALQQPPVSPSSQAT